MSEILLESDFLTVDLRSLYSNQAEYNTDNSQKPTEATNIRHELIAHGIPENTVEKLMLFGEPLKKALKVLGFRKNDPKANNNPILAFIKQDYVQKVLIDTGLLNASTFKAIYNAVSKKLVADSEFFKVNSYDIIYCRDLYKKSAKEIEEYLNTQSTILTVGASSYSGKLQAQNKKAFIHIDGLYREGTSEEELEPSKRAILVNKQETVAKSVTDTDAKINKLDFVKLVAGINKYGAEFGEDAQNELINKLKQIGVKLENAVFATLLALSLNTTSKKVRSAMADQVFANKSDVEVISAMNKLSTGNILPKEQMSASDADALADKLLVALNQAKANN